MKVNKKRISRKYSTFKQRYTKTRKPINCPSVYLVPVDSQLHEPIETIDVVAVGARELLDDVACVNFDRDERDELETLHFGQIAANDLREFIQHMSLNNNKSVTKETPSNHDKNNNKLDSDLPVFFSNS